MLSLLWRRHSEFLRGTCAQKNGNIARAIRPIHDRTLTLATGLAKHFTAKSTLSIASRHDDRIYSGKPNRIPVR